MADAQGERYRLARGFLAALTAHAGEEVRQLQEDCLPRYLEAFPRNGARSISGWVRQLGGNDADTFIIAPDWAALDALADDDIYPWPHLRPLRDALWQWAFARPAGHQLAAPWLLDSLLWTLAIWARDDEERADMALYTTLQPPARIQLAPPMLPVWLKDHFNWSEYEADILAPAVDRYRREVEAAYEAAGRPAAPPRPKPSEAKHQEWAVRYLVHRHTQREISDDPSVNVSERKVGEAIRAVLKPLGLPCPPRRTAIKDG